MPFLSDGFLRARRPPPVAAQFLCGQKLDAHGGSRMGEQTVREMVILNLEEGTQHLFSSTLSLCHNSETRDQAHTVFCQDRDCLRIKNRLHPSPARFSTHGAVCKAGSTSRAFARVCRAGSRMRPWLPLRSPSALPSVHPCPVSFTLLLVTAIIVTVTVVN